MKKIVSYSYFRSPTSIYEAPARGRKAGRQFEQFLPMLVRAHQLVWKGWELWIHHDSRVTELPYWPALKAMGEKGIVHLEHIAHGADLCKAMLWRLLPAWKGEVAAIACRDVDSVPLPRDRRAVEEWLASGKTVHAIHDNSAHSGVMGGTTSVRAPRFVELLACRDLAQFVSRGQGIDFTKQGADQDLLNRHLPLYAAETLVHDLHHLVGDMPGVETRSRISQPAPEDMDQTVAAEGDRLSNVIGGCTEPLPAFDFYDSFFEAVREVRNAERGVGVNARDLMVEIAGL